MTASANFLWFMPQLDVNMTNRRYFVNNLFLIFPKCKVKLFNGLIFWQQLSIDKLSVCFWSYWGGRKTLTWPRWKYALDLLIRLKYSVKIVKIVKFNCLIDSTPPPPLFRRAAQIGKVLRQNSWGWPSLLVPCQHLPGCSRVRQAATNYI